MGDGQVIEAAAADSEYVHVSLGDRIEGVATVTIDRPDARNALNAQVRRELTSVIRAIPESDVRVLIITGSDEAKAFVAGADITEFRDRDALDQRKYSARPRVYDLVADCPIPVIARINGHALGGGCELALACDIRIAYTKAKLGQPEINLGIMPGGGATQRLPRLVGQGHALRLILTGEIIDAHAAASIGLVDEVYDDGFDDRVYEIAELIATKSPIAIEFAKEAVKASERLSVPDGIDYETELFVQLFNTADKNEGIDAFFEDRDPEWQGR